MKPLHKRFAAFAAPVCVALSAVNALAQTTPAASADERLAKLEAAAVGAQSADDNAWMLICAALVLMMTGPGLALFYGGLVRRKNVLSTMMQSFALMAVVTVLWAAYGYSIAFAEGTPFFGNLSYMFLKGVGAEPNADYAATIPQQTFMVYQLMFAIITPALITGAFADHAFLLKGGVFTPQLIERWITYKREKEIQPLRMRPHPFEFGMYFDI